MNPLALKAAPWVAVAGACVLLATSAASHEREVGRLQVQLASADSMSKAAQADARNWQRKAAIDSGRAVALEADTAKANHALRIAESRYYALNGSLAASRHVLDSLLAQPHDTASNAIYGAASAYVAHADSSLRACSDGLTAADSALLACQRQGQAVKAQLFDAQAIVLALAKDTTAKAIQIRAIKAEAPGFWATWLPRIAAFGLGALAGRIGR